MPLWVSVLLGLGAMIYFPVYWEGVFLFLISDLLFGAGEAKFNGFTYTSFVVATLVLIGLELLKKKLKFYS